MELAQPEQAEPAAASRPLRFAARAFDLSLIAYVFGVVVIEIRGRLLGGDVFATRPLAGAQDPQQLLLILLAVVLMADTIPTALRGRTLGKLMLGLRVVRIDDVERAPGAMRATLRTAMVFGVLVLPPIAGVPLLAAFILSAVLDGNGRGLHDRLAGTLVVASLRPEPPAEGRAIPLAAPRPPHPDDV